MSLTENLLAAAVSGIVLAAAGGCAEGAAQSPPVPTTGYGAPMSAPAAAPAKHACKGQNSCKGTGGCKTDKHACKGQNACKGQGYLDLTKAHCDAAKAKVTKNSGM